LSGDFDFKALAKATPGFVGADLGALTGAAGIAAVKRIFHELGTSPPDGSIDAAMMPVANVDDMALDPPSLDSISLETPLAVTSTSAPFDKLPSELQILAIASFLRAHPLPLSEEQLAPLAITNADFQIALSQVQPSSKREGFTTVPDVTWSNVGALNNIREEVRMAIVQPVKHPALFESVGIASPCGVLLWGPPGCGKTLLAKAVANESRANFISVKGPELLNKVRIDS
jgi:ribosome biogenesis ATPase